MRRAVLRLGLLAYPRELRDRDGAELTALAEDLAADHGTVREAIGLLRGGLGERRRRAGRVRRAVTAVGITTGVALAFLSWSAAAEGGRAEVDEFACVGECAETEAAVVTRIRDGWICTERRDATAVTWRCTRD